MVSRGAGGWQERILGFWDNPATNPAGFSSHPATFLGIPAEDVTSSPFPTFFPFLKKILKIFFKKILSIFCAPGSHSLWLRGEFRQLLLEFQREQPGHDHPDKQSSRPHSSSQSFWLLFQLSHHGSTKSEPRPCLSS